MGPNWGGIATCSLFLALGLGVQQAHAQGTVLFVTNHPPGSANYGWVPVTISNLPIELSREITLGYPPPPNDHFTNAIELTGVFASAASTNYLATSEPGEPAHGFFPWRQSSWWFWTAPDGGLGNLTIESTPIGFLGPPLGPYLAPSDVWLGVYTGTGLTNLLSVPAVEGSSDLSKFTVGPKTFRFVASAGQTYFFAADCRSMIQLTFAFENLLLAQPTVTTNLPRELPVDLEFVSYHTNSEIAWLEAFAGTHSLGVLTNPPFQYVYTLDGSGADSIRAVATNRLGQSLVCPEKTLTYRPANDDLAEAAIVQGEVTEGTFTAHTEFATAGESDPELSAGVAPGHSVWWRWTAGYTANTVVTLTSSKSALAVFESDASQNLTRLCFLQGSDEVVPVIPAPGSPPFEHPNATFAAQAGRTYYVVAQSDSAVSWSLNQQTLALTPEIRGTAGLPVSLGALWQEANGLHPEVELIAGTRTWFYPFPLSSIVSETGRLAVALADPYQFDWVPAEPGLYSIWARATNSLGVRRESAKRDFYVYCSNDDFARASLIPGQTRETNFNFTTTVASSEVGEPLHKLGVPWRSLWWKWTPAYSANLRFKVVQEGRGMPLDVFTGHALSDLRRVAGNDGSTYLPGYSGAVRLRVRAGQTYFFRAADTRPSSPYFSGIPLSGWQPPPSTFILEPARPLAGELYFSFFKNPLRRTRQPQLEPAARAFMPDGRTLVSDTNFVAQLYAGPTTVSLQPMGPRQPFLTFSWAGLIAPTPVLITNVTALARVYAQVRVWNKSYGATYEAAQANGSDYGQSAILALRAGSEEIGPAPLTGLSSFTLERGKVRQ